MTHYKGCLDTSVTSVFGHRAAVMMYFDSLVDDITIVSCGVAMEFLLCGGFELTQLQLQFCLMPEFLFAGGLLHVCKMFSYWVLIHSVHASGQRGSFSPQYLSLGFLFSFMGGWGVGWG